METLQDGGVLGETELQQFTADIVDADSLPFPNLPTASFTSSIVGSAASGACSGNYSMPSRIEASSVGDFAFRSSWNHSFHRSRIDGLSRNNTPEAFLM